MRLLRRRRLLALAVPAGTAWLVFYAAWLAFQPWGERGATIFVDTAYLLPVAAATALSAYAFRRAPAGMRGFWALMTASNALWLGSELLWSVRELATGSVPFPWWTDAGYLASFALMPLALYAAFRPSLRTISATSLLDAALTVGSLALAWWAVVLRPLPLGLDPASLVGLAYPLFGLVLIAMLVATRALVSREGDLALRIVALGIACTAITDGVYTYAAVTHTYIPGDWIGLGWQAEAVCFCIAALAAARSVGGRRSWKRYRDPIPLGGVVAVGTLAALVAVLVYATLGHVDSTPLVAAALGLGGLLALRVSLLVRRGMQRRSFIDRETGTYDARYLDDQLRLLDARGRHFAEPFALAIAEIDDPASSHAGRAAVVGREIMRAVREVDVVARLGEERFAIAVPNVDADGAREIAEHVRAHLVRAVDPAAAGLAVPPTVSVGFALRRADEREPLTTRSERALAAARRLGGNQVRHDEDELAFGAAGEAVREFELMLAMAEAVDARENAGAGHSRAVASLARDIAMSIGLDGDALARVYVAGFLHDVGKIAVPETLLEKRGRLEQSEWAAIMAHAARGASILETVESVSDAAPIVAAHHERWDGGGYPRRLAGEAIPVEARVVAVADALVSMLAPRPYRPALSLTKALTEIWRYAGERYDPNAASALLALGREGTLSLALDGEVARRTLVSF